MKNDFIVFNGKNIRRVFNDGEWWFFLDAWRSLNQEIATSTDAQGFAENQAAATTGGNIAGNDGKN